jgi:hypothetical protein
MQLRVYRERLGRFVVVLQDREKYMEKLNRWKLEDIHKFMDLLDVPRGSGDKVCLLLRPAWPSFCNVHSTCMAWAPRGLKTYKMCTGTWQILETQAKR